MHAINFETEVSTWSNYKSAGGKIVNLEGSHRFSLSTENFAASYPFFKIIYSNFFNLI